jgi:hypothetical protein
MLFNSGRMPTAEYRIVEFPAVPTRPLLVLLAIVLATLVAVTRGRYYIAYSFAAVFVVWATTRPSKGRCLAVALIAAALWGIRLLYGEVTPDHPDSPAEQAFYMTAAFVGAGGLIMLALFPPPRESTIGRVEVAGTFAVAAFGLFADRWFRYMTDNPLPSLDRLLFALDGAIGFQASFVAGEVFAGWPAIAVVATTVYRMLPVTMALLFVWLPAHAGLRLRFLLATTAAGVVGYQVYRLCPAAGPAYAFPAVFPADIPIITPGWVQPTDMPSSLLNAFPSLHTTWALLVAAWAERLPPARRGVILALVTLTLFATLGLGEHYLVDLVAAVPFAVAFELLFAARPAARRPRALAIALCTAAFVAWVIAVSTGAALEVDAPLFRLLVLASVVVPALLRHAARTAEPAVAPELVALR